MENQALFSSKDKSEKLKCRLLQFLFGALRVNLSLAPNKQVDNNYIRYSQYIDGIGGLVSVSSRQ